MPNIPDFPSIPVPKEDLKSLNESVLALKQAVEMLTGQGDEGRVAPHVFIQSDQPEALHKGDLWLCTTNSATFNVWNGDKWLVLSNVPALAMMAIPEELQDRQLRLFNTRKMR